MRIVADFEKHDRVLIFYPYANSSSWQSYFAETRNSFDQVILTIAEYKTVILCVRDKSDFLIEHKNIELIEIETNDAWARDIAPIKIENSNGQNQYGIFAFNGYGGMHDEFEKDKLVPKILCEKLDLEIAFESDFVIDGGSILTDGKGTLFTTEQCILMSNPNYTKQQIEQELKSRLNVNKVIWFENGLANDETNGHVDNLMSLINENEVLINWTDDIENPNYKIVRSVFNLLESENFAIHKIELPPLQTRTASETNPRKNQKQGDDLAANYINFYNGGDFILLPTFDIPHDNIIIQKFKSIFSDKKIIPIYSRNILLGGGNIHCITREFERS